MANLYAKVIEDNGGGLHLYVMDETGTCIYAHYGYEYRPGALTDDIKVLIETDSVADWEGCEENVAEAWEKLEIDNIGYTKIAAVTDGELKLYPRKMGAAGQEEFGLRNPSVKELLSLVDVEFEEIAQDLHDQDYKAIANLRTRGGISRRIKRPEFCIGS